jgi:serine/threonine protein kinase
MSMTMASSFVQNENPGIPTVNFYPPMPVPPLKGKQLRSLPNGTPVEFVRDFAEGFSLVMHAGQIGIVKSSHLKRGGAALASPMSGVRSSRHSYSNGGSVRPGYGAQLGFSQAVQLAPRATSRPSARRSVISGSAPGLMVGSAPLFMGSQPNVMGRGNIKALLQDRSELKKAVVQAFKAACGGRNAIDINGLHRVRMDIAAKLGVPDAVFGSIEDEYQRFDFEGTGYLEANEVYKLIKWHLYEYSRAQDSAMGKNSVPMKNPAQAGFNVVRELGTGNQASIKLAVDQVGNQRCIKCFPKDSMGNMFSVEEMMEEFETMQRLACKNIARTFDIFQDHQFVYMVNEVYLGGDFTEIQKRAPAKGVALTEPWYGNVWRQCLDALNFMHQQAMMHCDIKEANLMMRTEDYANPQCVLIDFGLSKVMTKQHAEMVTGTPGYMPPETMNAGKWFPGGDVFSLGVVIFQMMAGKIPDDEAAKRGAPMIGLFLEGCNSLDDVRNLVNNKRPPVEMMRASPALQQMTLRMLEKNLRARPKAPAVLKDPWFASVSSPMAAMGAFSAPGPSTYAAPGGSMSFAAPAFAAPAPPMSAVPGPIGKNFAPLPPPIKYVPPPTAIVKKGSVSAPLGAPLGAPYGAFPAPMPGVSFMQPPLYPAQHHPGQCTIS